MAHGASFFVSSSDLWDGHYTPTTSCNNLKVFGVDNGGTVHGLVVCGPQADQFTAQFLLAIPVERCERARHWTVVGAVEFYYRIRRERVIKAIEVACKSQISDAFT